MVRRHGALAWLVGVLSAMPVMGETAPRVISSDTEWSGTVEIKSAVTIVGCTVRVRAGTVIRMDSGAGSAGPAIHLSSPGGEVTTQASASCARLLLEGTADNPVVVESPPGRPPGAIVGSPFSCASLVASHTTFRRLGPILSADRAEPALLIPLTSDDSDMSLRHCRFEACGPVRGEFFSAGGSAEVVGCRFEGTAGGTCLLFSGAGTGIKTVLDNRLDAGIRLECPQTLVRDNVLIGPTASINVVRPSATGVRIENNYVHNTSMRDEGQYALRTDAKDAVVRRNILVGGTYVVETAPAVLADNVLIGVSGLSAEIALPAIGLRDQAVTTTHHMVRALPGDGEVRGNLFLGPAYAALATGENFSQGLIEGNVFDGWDQANRAIQIDPSGAGQVQALLRHNVFARYRRPAVFAFQGETRAVVRAMENRFLATAEPAYAHIEGLSSATDGAGIVLDPAQLWPRPQATQTALSAESQLISGELTVKAHREQWFAAYEMPR